MAEYLNFNGGILADIADFLPGQLPAEHHPLHSHGGAQQHPGQGVHRQLGGAVHRHLRGNLAAQLGHPQVLHNISVHTRLRRFANQLGHGLEFPVRDQGVQRQVHGDTPDVAVFQRLAQGFQCEVLCALAGVKGSDAQIHRIGSVLHGSPQRIHRPGRGQ